ncbi:glycosyltransferase [Streptomonospora alba]|uniref:glycosyltransferase n=1 Tax=Streptomonospora alba TaxID=183763 RepID=UPI000A00CC34|nr:glycosyltransferase [Streptomonospora alba]
MECIPVNGYKFLSIFNWQWRKGWDILLGAYFDEFSFHEDVVLILRCDVLDKKKRSSLRRTMEEFSDRRRRRLPKVVLLETRLNRLDLFRLYAVSDSFVLPTRGEGWGRPISDAMAMGLPVVATNWSGNTEYMRDGNSFLVDCKIIDVHDDAAKEWEAFAGQKWAEPSIEHLRSIMRYLFENPQAGSRVGLAAMKEMRSLYSPGVVSGLFSQQITRLLRRS